MSATKTMDGPRLEEVLQEAITRNRPIVLTHHSPGGWRTFKSSFLSGSSSRRRIWIKPPTFSAGVQAAPPQPGDRVGVTFRVGHKKCGFGTTLEPGLDREEQSGTLVLRWPERLQQLQRRVFERVALPPALIVPVRFWREPALLPSGLDARDVRHGQLEDISLGGMRVRVAGSRDVEVGATYRCAFAPREGKPPIVLDALVRHREATEGARASIGFQFVGLECVPDGERITERLTRAIAQFQRARSRKGRPPRRRSGNRSERDRGDGSQA